jgi:hypothetical protein
MVIAAEESMSRFTASFGISIHYYTDKTSMLTLHEGLEGQFFYKAYEIHTGHWLSLQLLPGIKTGLFLEGATSMDHIFIPERTPVFVPMLPGIKLNFALGRNWNISLNSFAGPYFYSFNDYYIRTLLNLEFGIGLSWYCFRNSGFELQVDYGYLGNEFFFKGFGGSLLYTWRM